jgi:hypothetical protein
MNERKRERRKQPNVAIRQMIDWGKGESNPIVAIRLMMIDWVAIRLMIDLGIGEGNPMLPLG